MENLERNSISWHLNQANHAQGRGFCFVFFRPGGWSFALKSCPQGGDFDEKH